MLKHTRVTDPEVYEIVADELRRQEHNIEMIASESTAPLEVMDPYLQTKPWRDILERAFRQAPTKPTDLSFSGLSVRRNCTVQSMSIFRFIPALRQIMQFMQQYSSLGIRFSV